MLSRPMVIAVLALLVVLTTGSLASAARSTTAASRSRKLPHLDLEMTGAEYARILNEHPPKNWHTNWQADALDPIVAIGTRNLAWLMELNRHRDSAHQISLSSADTEPGFPMDAPREINEKISLQEYADLTSTMPQAIRSVLLGTGPLPIVLPVSEADYIKWGFKTDRVYQMAVRWIMERNDLDQYARLSQTDIRGIYSLDRVTGLGAQLKSWSTLANTVQTQYRGWLIGVCGNQNDRKDCAAELDQAIASKGVSEFFDKYASTSRKMYDDFFKLEWNRQDIVWTQADPKVLTIPFIDPHSPVIASYLQDNIEDEWRMPGWNLRMKFLEGDKKTTAHLQFQKAVTPHVVPPNLIVIDENQPFTEYDARWMIRHEFGHILGFPDCYVEFYDTDREAMVSYQLDTTNLMCSRQGHFKQIHFDELKRVYFK